MSTPQDGYDPYGDRRPQQPPGPPPAAYPNAGGGYDPYGAPRPPQERGNPFAPRPRGDVPTARPSRVHVAAALLVLGALPWLLFGIVLAAAPFDPQDLIDIGVFPAEGVQGISPAEILSALQALGAVFAVIAIAYLVLVGFTWAGRNWARITVTVLTALFAILLLLSLVTTLSPVAFLLFALPVAGVALLFIAPVPAWFAGRRGEGRRN